MVFPAVTFCNLNQWRRSASQERTLNMISTTFGFNDTLRDEFNWTEFYQYVDKEVISNVTANSLNPQVGALSLKEMLVECLWNGVEKCDDSDFDKVITDLGVCYTFNNPSNRAGVRVVNRPGTNSGLALTLNIVYDEYIRGEFQGAGIKVCKAKCVYFCDTSYCYVFLMSETLWALRKSNVTVSTQVQIQ